MMVETLYVSNLNKDGFTLKNGVELTIRAIGENGPNRISKTFKSFQNVLEQTSFLQPFKVTCDVRKPKTVRIGETEELNKEFDKEVASTSVVTIPVELVSIEEGQHDIVTAHFSRAFTKDVEITIDLIAHKSFFNSIVFGYMSFKLGTVFDFKLESSINLIDKNSSEIEDTDDPDIGYVILFVPLDHFLDYTKDIYFFTDLKYNKNSISNSKIEYSTHKKDAKVFNANSACEVANLLYKIQLLDYNNNKFDFLNDRVIHIVSTTKLS